LINADWLVGGLWIVSNSLDIHARIRFEEARMLDRFGDVYRVYMQRTGALLPRL
jgi:protein-S-isoprenylcysteine O-methyltransferase Ste14